jgi:NADH dehydrogenase
MKKVLILGSGFAGLNAARKLARVRDVEVTVIDRENHHLFQPLLYQVAMAALSPADIAAPIRSLLSSPNTRIIKAAVHGVDVGAKRVATDAGEFAYDYLLVACGAQHAYFGHEEWEPFAPGLKTLSQATEIRRRVLEAFEAAERESDTQARRRHLTFVVVGGGPTGVELAGAIGEMSRYTLARDFRSIDPRQTRVMLVEAGPRILPAFDEKLAARAMRDLESLGVQVWTSARVTQVSAQGVVIGNEQINGHELSNLSNRYGKPAHGELSSRLRCDPRSPKVHFDPSGGCATCIHEFSSVPIVRMGAWTALAVNWDRALPQTSHG